MDGGGDHTLAADFTIRSKYVGFGNQIAGSLDPAICL